MTEEGILVFALYCYIKKKSFIYLKMYYDIPMIKKLQCAAMNTKIYLKKTAALKEFTI